MNLKTRFKLSPLFRPANAVLRVIKRAQWRLGGSKLPPLHEIKQYHLLQLKKRFGPSVFVETGTYRGKMIFAMRPYFERLVSIELAEHLARRAEATFAGCPEVTIVRGDSAERLREILDGLDEAALFWLDGHYSGGETGHGEKSTPIMEELEAIFGHHVSNHVIAIDDALCFGQDPDYPNIDRLRDMVYSSGRGRSLDVVDNMILIVPENG
jgi:hypothetical protein